jgi:hypothetical protein
MAQGGQLFSEIILEKNFRKSFPENFLHFLEKESGYFFRQRLTTAGRGNVPPYPCRYTHMIGSSRASPTAIYLQSRIELTGYA